MKKNNKLDLKKITIAKLNNKSAESIKGGDGSITTIDIVTEGGQGSIGSAATCVFEYKNTVSRCLRES